MACVYLSAAHKSSGKTTAAIGLLAAFAERGFKVQPFKKGPDYIDPMWLRRASGRSCYNLDYNTQTETEIRNTFTRHAARAEFALIEGNKGLHDGVDVEGRDCNAAMAKLLNAPVVLVLDTSGLTRGIAPLVVGYLAFDPDVTIAGIILNRVAGPRHEGKLRAALEYYTDVPILGALGRDDQLDLAERHLGLTTPCEVDRADKVIGRLRRAARNGIDLDRIAEIAAPHVPTPDADGPDISALSRDVRLGIARDAAFGFYYPDDLEALERAGAELVFFDTLRDSRLPRVDGLFIGGGFPETQMVDLEANASLRREIRKAAASGLPVYAECGGLMYLCRSISWEGKSHEMVGAVPFDAVMHRRPQGRGLVRLEDTGRCPWAPPTSASRRRVCAHEFHHAALENGPTDAVYAYRVKRGFGIDGAHDGFVTGNLMASFCHLRDTAQDHWAERFVSFVRACKRGSRGAATVSVEDDCPGRNRESVLY